MAKITVIVPIYNVEKYLRTCFDSLLKQTYLDYEVLAVNDGSPDDSQTIIDEYVSKYPDKIKCIQKENGGYGSVLEMAIGKIDTPYFLICDPDDYLSDDALEHLFNLASLSEADITIGAKYFIYEGSSDQDYDAAYNTNFTTLKVNSVYNNGTLEYNDLFFIDPSPHSKLYKKDVAKNISFPHKVGYTDNLLFYMSMLNAKKVVYTNKACAYYLVDRVGNTMTDIRPKAMYGQVEVFNTIMEQSESVQNVPDMFYYRMFESYKFMLYQSRRVACDKNEYSLILDNLYSFVSKLISHNTSVLSFYKKYAKCGILEKMRDKAILSPNRSKSVYDGLKRKMLSEFKEK